MAQGFSSSPIAYNDEFDTSVAIFNIAATWFHLHDYAKSFSYLDALYQNIEPIDAGTALRICLLLLDIALLSGYASRSAVSSDYDILNLLAFYLLEMMTCRDDSPIKILNF
ncbi:CCR4-NOT transcription complex subunit 10-like [Olea europaea var. sylvestris]|uniref:CCR4-NOT transcription complex subunit 10-like n=1 Tax=Olea europaea var. sylvestris TaxID=158386 RepID=UPI000C1CD1E6|nr:CCR4-NOT transcription complex subunit 10-like [Olea europaea var. sylvestris]